jgi:transcriptional regulator with XRE-family HTH domain
MIANKIAVGGYLRRLRELNDLTITEVAAAMETNESQIRNIETGRRETRTSLMINLCSYLKGNLDDIAQLMLSETATAEKGRSLAENWVASREYQQQQQMDTTYQ